MQAALYIVRFSAVHGGGVANLHYSASEYRSEAEALAAARDAVPWLLEVLDAPPSADLHRGHFGRQCVEEGESIPAQ